MRERRNPAFEAITIGLRHGLDFCLAHPWATTLGSVLLLAGSLLLVPTIGAEFMPHLDEGALWIRATMPYTISFEESRKIAPQVRAILRSFPEVTVVASEHGRPDDGTDPTGFFNGEFFVGLKPYREWHGALPHEGAADRGDQREARRPSPASSSTTPSRPRTRWTRPRPASRAPSP